jgi:hypothetical protein
VDIRPQQQQGGSLRQSVEQSADDKTATECTSPPTFVSVVVQFVNYLLFSDQGSETR